MAVVEKIWVVAEAIEGKAVTSTLENLTAARRLASRVEAVTWGAASTFAAELGDHGADTVFSAGELGGALPGVPVAAAIAALAEWSGPPAAVLLSQTYDGRDIGGRLSARLDAPVLTNVFDLTAEGGGLVAHLSIFGGTELVKARFTSDKPGIFVARPKSFAAEGGAGSAAQIVPIDVPDTGALNGARIVGRHVEARNGPKLDEAVVVVAGGRGLGGSDRYELIEELATLLHGAPGASRAIVDAGWVPYSYQIGQTGKTVTPTVYIACGISGATQHMVGMKGAQHIIAINKDHEAPIFSVADLGVIGDVHKILPQLIEALKARP